MSGSSLSASESSLLRLEARAVTAPKSSRSRAVGFLSASVMALEAWLLVEAAKKIIAMNLNVTVEARTSTGTGAAARAKGWRVLH